MPRTRWSPQLSAAFYRSMQLEAAGARVLCVDDGCVCCSCLEQASVTSAVSRLAAGGGGKSVFVFFAQYTGRVGEKRFTSPGATRACLGQPVIRGNECGANLN